jgi:predicted dehydrogenase
MGIRHIDSLLKIGGNDLVIVRRDPSSNVEQRHSGIPVIGSLTEALDQGSEAVVIASATSAHADSLKLAMQRNLPVLVEKPVADTEQSLIELQAHARESNSRVVVGYDLRFCGALDQLKLISDSGRLGQIAFASLDAGGYLPAWRPELDYRDLYSSNRKLGGGVTLDLVHEIDSMLALFGTPDFLTATLAQKGSLEIDVEDVAQMAFEFTTGPLVMVRVDYLRRPFARSYTVVGADGTAVWSEQDDRITVFSESSQNGEILWTGQSQDAFELEMRHFLDVVEGKSVPKISLEEGIKSAQLAILARRSSDQGRKLEISSMLN